MVKGSVQTKNGCYYTVIYYYDSQGKRKQKWQNTGLSIRGNKRKADELLKQRIAEMEISLTTEKREGQGYDVLRIYVKLACYD